MRAAFSRAGRQRYRSPAWTCLLYTSVFQPLVEKQGFGFAKPDEEAYYQAFRDADVVHFYLPFRFCRRGEEIARPML